MPTATATDRRLCPVCGRLIATRETGGTYQLILREHGGKVALKRRQASFGGTQTEVSGGCLGSAMPVERVEVVWRVVGNSRCPLPKPTYVRRSTAELRAREMVRGGSDGVTEAVVQQFDLATQTWVAVGAVTRASRS